MAWPLIVAGALAAGGAAANYMGNKSDAERAEEAYNRIQGLAESAGAANQSDINAYKNLVAQTYGNGAANYNTALTKFLNSKVYQNDPFSYTNPDGSEKTVEQFMDPAANQRVAAAMQAIENSAASGGNRFSSDFINRVGAKQQAMASEEWEKAYNRLMQDKNSAMQEYQLNSNNAWNNYNATNTRNQYAVDAYGNDRNQYINGLSDAMSAGIQNRNALLNTQAQTISGTANANQGTSGWDLLGGLAGAGGQFMASYFGGK